MSELGRQALYKDATRYSTETTLLQDRLDVLLLGVVDERGIVFCTGQQWQPLSLLLLLAVVGLCVTLALLRVIPDAGEFLLVRVVFSKVARSKRNVGQIIEIDEIILVLVNWQIVLVFVVEFCKRLEISVKGKLSL